MSENNLNAYRARNDSSRPDIRDTESVEQSVRLENQLTELDFAEAEISQQFTKSHPRNEALLTKRARLKDEKNRLDERVNDLTCHPAGGSGDP